MIEMYAVLIVSHQPIDVSSAEADQENLQHLVKARFAFESNGKGGWRVVANPEENALLGGRHLVAAEGAYASVAIVNWFQQLVSSLWYIPFYKRREK